MGYAINFEGSNKRYGAPKGMTEEQVYTLDAQIGLDEPLDSMSIITCWEFDGDEAKQMLETLLETGKCKVFVNTLASGLPPMNLSPFKQPQKTMTLQELISHFQPKTNSHEQAG